jgi:hypothetical protein
MRAWCSARNNEGKSKRRDILILKTACLATVVSSLFQNLILGIYATH